MMTCNLINENNLTLYALCVFVALVLRPEYMERTFTTKFARREIRLGAAPSVRLAALHGANKASAAAKMAG